MNKIGLVTHGAWAAVVGGAVLLGLVSKPEEGMQVGEGGVSSAESGSDQRAAIRVVRGSSGPASNARNFAVETKSVMAETDKMLRINRANRLINGLTPEVLEGMTLEMVPDLLQLFRDVRYSAGVSFRTLEAHRAFVAAWARLDPEAAARYAADRSKQYYVWKVFPGGSTAYRMADIRAGSRRDAIVKWAKVDLAAAKQFAAGLDYKYARRDMTLGLMKHLASTDLDEAIVWSAELEAVRVDKSKRLELPDLVSQLRKQRGMEAVKKWFDGMTHLPSSDGSLSYKQSAAIALAKDTQSIKYSRNWSGEYVDFLKENANQPFLTAKLLTENNWSPSYSIERIIQLPKEIGARRQAVGDEFERYVNSDFKSAGEWLRRQDLGPVHDEAIQVYVRQATTEDVDAAMRWAEQITDPGLRNETINYVRERGGK